MYAAMDARAVGSAAVPRGQQIEQPLKTELAQDFSPPSHGACVEWKEQNRFADGRAQSSLDNLPAQKRRKVAATSVCLCVGLLVANVFFAFINPQVQLGAIDAPAMSQRNDSQCTGGDPQPHMNQAEVGRCVGEQGDICHVHCDTGFVLIGEMRCDQGRFHGASCVSETPSGARRCVGADDGYSDKVLEPLFAHFNDASMAACQGPVGSACEFQCEPGPLARCSCPQHPCPSTSCRLRG